MKVIYQIEMYDVVKQKVTVDTYTKVVLSYHVGELVIQALKRNPVCISAQIVD